MRNWNRKPIANIIAAVKWILPPHNVASQLKILMPVGTEMAIVAKVKKVFAPAPMPTANMWCAHTLKLMKPIPTEAATIAGYPKMALREKTGMISLAKAKAGSTRI